MTWISTSDGKVPGRPGLQNSPELSDALARLSKALNELGIRYALIGGIAVILRGYDRATQDVDAVVLDADNALTSIWATFDRHGLKPRITDAETFARRNRILLLHSPDGTAIDVSMGALPYEIEVVERATQENLTDRIAMPVATAEDLVIMKLVAARSRDIDDVRRLVELYPDMDRVRIRRVVSDFASALDEPELLRNLFQILGAE